MPIPPLLEELLVAPGVSGSEDAIQAIVRREADAMGAEITTDVLGSTVARVRGSGSGRLLALFAHADQIGMVIRGAGDDGLLTFARLASSRAQDACGQRVRVVTAEGEVRGVVVAPHDGEITWDVLRIDIGALDRDDALRIVHPGDAVVLFGPPEELPNGRVLSGALDDRIGVCIPLRYVHTAGEIAQLTDVEATAQLIEAYARSLTAESSFLR